MAEKPLEKNSYPIPAINQSSQIVLETPVDQLVAIDELAHIAIVKLVLPQSIDDMLLRGVAKTLTQLRTLGLLSVIVVDSGTEYSRTTIEDQTSRLLRVFDQFGEPGAVVLSRIMAELPQDEVPSVLSNSHNTFVQFPAPLIRAVKEGVIPIIPPLRYTANVTRTEQVSSGDISLALTRYFSGLQDVGPNGQIVIHPESSQQTPNVGVVERIIIIDPQGGIPIAGRADTCHRFVNLAQEFDSILAHLSLNSQPPPTLEPGQTTCTKDQNHIENLKLANAALAILPATSSAVVASPHTAANISHSDVTPVATRNKQNPLIHNLLTDKPIYSSSLPLDRIRSERSAGRTVGYPHIATLVKKGMPLTVYPDPRVTPWAPPIPGSSRLRLTDKCIDLPRLVHLIEDSFNRKLDVEDYLKRLNDNLAGVIIAGEYEGGAILTWERPDVLSQEDAYNNGRLVPYLDKFAVLKSRQGSGGVADIVFNSMVRDCFPEGVCWRSRQNNPVNKWYFERSVGTWKLKDTNWTMFWTTPHLRIGHPTILDYENICRGVQPSWADADRPPD
jgi:amino-acid N-acetyltransferase